MTQFIRNMSIDVRAAVHELVQPNQLVSMMPRSDLRSALLIPEVAAQFVSGRLNRHASNLDQWSTNRDARAIHAVGQACLALAAQRLSRSDRAIRSSISLTDRGTSLA